VKRRFVSRGSRGRGGLLGDWESPLNQWQAFQTIASGAGVSIPLIGLIPTQPASVNAVPVGSCIITEVDAQIDVADGSAAGHYALGVGMYVGEYDQIAGTFSTQSPMDDADAVRDNWLHLQMYYTSLSLNTAATAGNGRRVGFHYKKPITIHQGQQLKIALTCAANPGSLYAMSSIRFRVRRVW